MPPSETEPAVPAAAEPSPPPTAPVVGLRLLGVPAVEGVSNGGQAAASRPRSLALLALLAGEPGPSNRDRLLVYLWPDSSLDRARNSLKQAVFELRRALGQDAVLSSPAGLTLNRDRVRCDLWLFDARLAEGDLAGAVALATGPFLDGLFLSGLPEFERWVEGERQRIRRRVQEAIEELARAAAARQDHREAVGWWRRAAQADPLSGRAAVGLMRALAAAGDRAAALEHAREHARRVRADLDAEPDAAVGELAGQLRRATDRGPEAPPPAVDRAGPGPGAGSPPVARRRRLRRRVLAGGLVLALAAAAGAYAIAGAARDRAAADDMVLVFPFQILGDSSLAYLGPGLMHLLGSGLDGAGRLRAMPAGIAPSPEPGAQGLPMSRAAELARRAGAGRFLLGEAVASGGQVQLSASLYRVGDRQPARAAVSGQVGAVFDLARDLAGGLIAALHPAERDRLIRAAAATSGSLEALRAYLAGEDGLRTGRYAAAAEDLSRAVALDSTFAMAYHRLSVAADWAGQRERAEAAADAALRHADRLAPRDRALLEGYRAFQRGDFATAERRYGTVVDEYPRDLEGWFGLAETLFHGNPLRGRSSVEARAAYERVLAGAPDDGEALVHLARIAFAQGRNDEARRLAARALAITPDSTVIELRAVRAFALGDRPGARQITRDLLATPALVSGVSALQVAVFLDDLEGTERFARALVDPSNAGDVRGHGHRMLAEVRIAEGRWREAMAELDRAEPFDASAGLELRSLFVSLPFLPVPDSLVARVRGELLRWRAADEGPSPAPHSRLHVGAHSLLRLHRLGLLNSRLGDPGAARAYADTLLAGPGRSELAVALGHSVRADLAARAGDPRGALAQLDSAQWARVADVSVAEARDRLLRADQLALLGQAEEALGWYGAIAERASYELVYLAPAANRRAELLARRGDRKGARAEWQRVLRLWSGADPELAPLVRAARAALERP
jgi:DNA-binding SARP family transcriptional activator/Tfp pilus assembly protein PilF